MGDPTRTKAGIVIQGVDADGIVRQVLINADGSLAMPTGAAGTPSTDVISVQGVASGTAIPTARRGTLTSKSGTANGSSQAVAASNASRSYFSFQNPSGNSGTMWVDPLGGTASSGSPRIEVKPGQGFAWSGEAVPTNAITVIGTNTEKWTAYEF